jgi:hypothetical protein
MNTQRYRTQFDSHLALNEKPLLARPLFQPFSPVQAIRVRRFAAFTSVSQERHCHAQNLVVILQK